MPDCEVTEGRFESGWTPGAERDQRASSPSKERKDEQPQTFHILLAEDNPPDVVLVREAFAVYGLDVVLQVVEDGEQAIHFIERVERDENARCPDLLLLDLNLPKRTGAEVLARIRQSAKCGHMPVIIVTSSDSRRDREETARLGATRYFRKPLAYDEFVKVGEVVREVLDLHKK